MPDGIFPGFVDVGKTPEDHAFIDYILLPVVGNFLYNIAIYLLNIADRLTLILLYAHNKSIYNSSSIKLIEVRLEILCGFFPFAI